MRSACLVLLALHSCLIQAIEPTYEPVVIWYAPFLSGGGYCSEAHSYVESISSALSSMSHHDNDENLNDEYDHMAFSSSRDSDVHTTHTTPPFTLYVSQHGDSVNAAFLRDLSDTMRDILEKHWIEERDLSWRLKSHQLAVAICHSEPGAWHPARYKTSRCPPSQALYTVGRTMFETDRVPSGWSERMNQMDEIWVPTRFQQQVFIDGGVQPDVIHVVPEAVDTEFFNPQSVHNPFPLESDIQKVHPDAQITDQTTVFLSIFKWEERKGWRVLLKAYWQAFTSNEDVVLVILTNGYHTTTESASDFMQVIGEFAQLTQNRPLSSLARVHVLQPHLAQNDLPSLYKAATAFVLPSHGEGWGRPHVEAMAMGLPVIATFWSGTTEFMTDDNSYPLHIDGLVEILEGPFKGHQWANPSITHLIELFQHVHTHPDEARLKGKRARDDMMSKYSPTILGELLVSHISRILAHLHKLENESDQRQNEKHEEL